MTIVRIPSNTGLLQSRPITGALEISRSLKEEYKLVHNVDYKWYWDKDGDILIIELADGHETLASLIALRFMGANLAELWSQKYAKKNEI